MRFRCLQDRTCFQAMVFGRDVPDSDMAGAKVFA
jgi:hypothetical protein